MQQQLAYMQSQCPILASANPRIMGMQQAPISGSSYQQPPINLEQVGGNCPATKEGLLNVHIICHTHLDTGWVETFDQYYYGYVETIINSVVKSLLENPRRRFIFVETSFFMRWWRDQNEFMRSKFKKLVNNGQMEFISGGWSMNDEAVSHYSAIIDQMTMGHKNLYRLFGQCGGIPKIGWQIDPFGHSREYASLLSQMGFDGLFLGRIDFQDKMFRQQMQSMEFVWKSSPSLGSMKTDLFTCILPNTYSPPEQFCFDVNCNDEQLNKYNIQHKAAHFTMMMMKQAEFYATNHTLVTMGMDFHYRDANKWYTNLDMLVDEIQSNQQKYKINLVYSTPSCYLKNIHKQSHVSWPVKLDDFFPYADAHNSYWTGYFTSRPGLKYQIVMGNNFLQAAKQLSVLANPLTNQDAVMELESLQETLGILQHHDAVTGTCKQFVNDDYSRMLAHAMKKAHHSLVTSVAKIIEHNQRQPSQQMSTIDNFIMKGEHIFCSSLNASHCQISEKLDRFEKLLIHTYNPASHTVQHYVQIPVRDGRYIVREAMQLPPNSNQPMSIIASQQTPIPPSVLRLTSIESRQDYGVIDPEVSKEFIFAAILPPLTMATYIIEKVASSPVGSLLNAASTINSQQQSPYSQSKPLGSLLQARLMPMAQPMLQATTSNNIVRRELLSQVQGDMIFGNSRISGIIDQNTGLLKAIQFADGRRLPFKQNFYYYDADGKYRPEKNSGAYIFNPSDRGSMPVVPKVAEVEVIRGPVVEEVHQVFSSWCTQVIKIYKHSDYIEFHWLVGPIPIHADPNNPSLQGPITDNGREIISRYETDMKTNGTFFTDSNGRETIRRLRDHRSDYHLYTSEHTASNYYPITSWIFIRDYDRNLQLSILPDRPQGGSSLHDGQVELMLHRRLLQDDGLGMDEPLNEPGIDRRGLIIRGKHYLLIGPIDSVIRSTRQLSKQLLMHPIQWFQAPPMTMNLGSPPTSFANNVLSSAGVNNPAPAGSSLGGINSDMSANMQPRFKFSGLRDYLPKMLNLLTLESWDQENVLIRLEHIFEINEDADYSRPVQVSLKRMFKNFKIIKVREMTLDALQDVEVARTNRLRFQTSTNPYKNYTDELGDFVNIDYVQNLAGNSLDEDLFIIELRPMEIRTFLVQINYN